MQPRCQSWVLSYGLPFSGIIALTIGAPACNRKYNFALHWCPQNKKHVLRCLRRSLPPHMPTQRYRRRDAVTEGLRPDKMRG
ncbi:hypothetical protein OF83DRAFT_1156886, partial [Amylostereum chailletii]